MKNKIVIITTLFLFFPVVCSIAQDIRHNMKSIDEQRRYILDKSFQEVKKAEEDYKKTLKEIEDKKNEMLKAISELKRRKESLTLEGKQLNQDIEKLTKKQELLSSILEKSQIDIKELIGEIRVNAKDLETILRQSPYSAIKRYREEKLKPILDKTNFPGIADLETMVKLLFDEILNSSEVSVKKGIFVDRDGKERQGDILFIGPFTQVYHVGDKTGFLLYSDKSESFFALSKPAPYFVRKSIEKYLKGESDLAPIDISKGGAIREFLYEMSLFDTISSGGLLVWPIITIGFLGILIVIERFYVLHKSSSHPISFMDNLMSMLKENRWKDATLLCNKYKNRLIPEIILKGLKNRDVSKEEMENILQEEILKKIPSLERFLSTLGMLTKISPLLGLLGTVTGMINTFHVITYFGTSDPKLMASGISEALVTTMLGLCVAIPLMFFHTILSRKVENIIAKMEENAVTFINFLKS